LNKKSDPLGFLENMAEMDMNGLMKMLRSTFGPIMDEEIMMVVEDVMRSIDMEMVGDMLNGLTAVIR